MNKKKKREKREGGKRERGEKKAKHTTIVLATRKPVPVFSISVSDLILKWKFLTHLCGVNKGGKEIKEEKEKEKAKKKVVALTVFSFNPCSRPNSFSLNQLSLYIFNLYGSSFAINSAVFTAL